MERADKGVYESRDLSIVVVNIVLRRQSLQTSSHGDANLNRDEEPRRADLRAACVREKTPKAV